MLLTMSTPQLYSSLRAMETRRPRGWADAGTRGNWRGTTGPLQCVFAWLPSVTSLPGHSGQVAIEQRSLSLRAPDSGRACVLSTTNAGEVIGQIWGSALGGTGSFCFTRAEARSCVGEPGQSSGERGHVQERSGAQPLTFFYLEHPSLFLRQWIKCLPLSGNHEGIRLCW